MMKFEETLKAQARQRNVNLDCETDFPTTLAINAFRGYLDEFNKKKKPMKDVPLRETKKEKKTRKEKEREQIMVCLVIWGLLFVVCCLLFAANCCCAN